MMRRIVVIALAAAAVFAAILGAASPAQDPEATSSPDSTPTVIATAPAETAAPEVTATIPAETPTETATQAPTETATQAPTADAPTPEATAEQTATSSPAPEATGTATPGHSPEGAAPSKGVTRKSPTKKPNSEQKIVKVEKKKCSTSTSGRECGSREVVRDDQHEVTVPAPQLTTSTGSPAPTNPSYSLATPGPAPIGVPNFFIDKFRIPPFLLSIYQAAGMQYGVRWEVLAAINEIETDYGRNLNVSYAGALGWMQFMPATWKMYGVDANRDGAKDPYNPVDAIFAAARYLRAAGADTDLRKAIFAYNHADWYVDSVLLRARVIGGLPSDLVGSLTGLTQGRFPVHAKATYAGKLEKADQTRQIRQWRQRRRGRRVRRPPPRDRHLRQEGRTRGRRQRRQGRQDRPQRPPRPLREAARRLRQHLHLRAPRRGRQDLPGAQEAHRQALGDPPRAQARQGAEVRRLRDQGARRQAQEGGGARRSPSSSAWRPRARRSRPCRQGAPVRQPGAPERQGRRRRRAARPLPGADAGRAPPRSASTRRTSSPRRCARAPA